MLEVASEIVMCLIIATLIGGVIGYIIGKNSYQKHKNFEFKKNQNEEEIGIKLGETSFPKIIGVAPTTLLSQARKGDKDDLTRIKGVGSVLEKGLNEIGIYHFDQVANLSVAEANWLDNSIAFIGRVEREEWIEQAKKLT